MPEEKNTKTLKGKELYNEDGSMPLDIFKLQRDIALKIAPIFHQKVNEDGLEVYKLKHIVNEAFDLLNNSAICGELENLDELIFSIKNFKHSDEFFDDDLLNEDDTVED